MSLRKWFRRKTGSKSKKKENKFEEEDLQDSIQFDNPVDEDDEDEDDDDDNIVIPSALQSKTPIEMLDHQTTIEVTSHSTSTPIHNNSNATGTKTKTITSASDYANSDDFATASRKAMTKHDSGSSLLSATSFISEEDESDPDQPQNNQIIEADKDEEEDEENFVGFHEDVLYSLVEEFGWSKDGQLPERSNPPRKRRSSAGAGTGTGTVLLKTSNPSESSLEDYNGFKGNTTQPNTSNNAQPSQEIDMSLKAKARRAAAKNKSNFKRQSSGVYLGFGSASQQNSSSSLVPVLPTSTTENQPIVMPSFGDYTDESSGVESSGSQQPLVVNTTTRLVMPNRYEDSNFIVAESSTGVLIIDYVAAESAEEEAGLTKGMFVIGVNGAQTEVVGKEKIMSLLKESEKLELDVQEDYGFLSNDSRRSSVYGFEAIPIDLTKDTNPSKQQIIGEDEDDSGDDEIILQRQRSGSICEGFDDGTSSNVNVSPTKFDSSQQMSSLAENKEETGSPAWRKPHIVSPIGRKPYMILSWGDQSYSRTGRESSTDPDPIPEGAPIILQTPPRSALKGSRNRKPAEGVRFNMAGEIITPGTEMESDLRERPRTPPPMVSEDEDPAVLMMRDQLTAGELSVPQYSRVVLMLYEAQSDPLVQLVRTKMLNPETTPEELVHIIAVLIRATEVLADIGDD